MSCRTTSGGSVSVSLARAATGLSDREVQSIFHALKREAAGMRGPSELALAEWRDRQQQLLERMNRMSATKKDQLRQKMFRSRSEPVPDGATFYAWSRVEARARQEVAIRSITSAIELAPPGSQADQYELGPDGRPTHVWYASYGSNLSRDRFMTYIKGGRPDGGSRTYPGCTDTAEPTGDIGVLLPNSRPLFALTSRTWGGGGIAFIDNNKGEQATGLGRAYRISIEQYDQVVHFENGGLMADMARPVPLQEALTSGRSVIGPGPYETIVHVGDYQGAPVLTFTSPWSTRDAIVREGYTPSPKGARLPVMTNKPSAAYVRMIGTGLKETFPDLDDTTAADYLRGCPGGDRYSRKDIVKILRSPAPAPPPERAPRPRTGRRGSEALGPGGRTWRSNWDDYGSDDILGAPLGARDFEGTSGGRMPSLFSDAESSREIPEVLAGVTGARSGTKVEEPRKGRKKGRKQDDKPTGTVRQMRQEQPTGTPRRRGASRPDGEAFPRVMTYKTIDEQQVGVKRWRKNYDDQRRKVTKLEQEQEATEAQLAIARRDGRWPNNVAFYEIRLQAIQTELARAQAAHDEARAKWTQAKEQSPSDYYLPASAYSVTQWQALRETTERRHMDTQWKFDAATDERRLLQERQAAATSAAERAGLSRAVAAKDKILEQAAKTLREHEERTAEIDAKLETARQAEAEGS